ncbi:nesprin-4 [Heteronotia binoei]|uniref:nesprin-4 n=1 Tax=Heteronotia binoei TaxID=13085 RepID=UPI002930DEAC|nr:nesprin-4 [Heteronotia binoei]
MEKRCPKQPFAAYAQDRWRSGSGRNRHGGDRKPSRTRSFRFQDWLWAAEATVSAADSSQVSYAGSKKELQRFEVLQKQVLEKLMPLEDLNRQYRQLARTGSNGLHLRSVVQDVNQRWDDLQRRASAIYKRLKYFVSQREEFESERETIRVWLTELDLRLTDVEHFSGGTSLEKIIQLQAFQQDVQSNAERVDQLLVRGECLIQKSQPEDAEVLEEELQDLTCFCQEVFRRVFRFRRRLVSMRLVFENEWLSDRDSDVESDCFTEGSLDRETDSSLPALGQMRQSTPKKSPQRNQCLACSLGTAMDLEWDPSVDVGGSTSHDEEDSSYYSAITGVGQWDEPSRKGRNSRRTCRHFPLRCGSQEDPSGRNGLQEELEQYNCSSADQMPKEVQLGHSRESPLEYLEKGQHLHPSAFPWGKGTGRQAEPMSFDPRRIESWLGQTHWEKLETEQVARSFGGIPPPAPGLPFPVESQRKGQRVERQKRQQRIKKKSWATPVSQAGQSYKKKQTDSCSGEIVVTIEKGYDLPQPLGISAHSQQFPRIPTLLNRLMLSTVGLLLLLLLASACVLSLADPSCLRTNGYTRSFHLVLKHINGPPPT